MGLSDCGQARSSHIIMSSVTALHQPDMLELERPVFCGASCVLIWSDSEMIEQQVLSKQQCLSGPQACM